MKTTWQIWGWPIFFAITSTIGLISALVGDGWWNVLSWLMLLPPVLAVSLCFPSLNNKKTINDLQPDRESV